MKKSLHAKSEGLRYSVSRQLALAQLVENLLADGFGADVGVAVRVGRGAVVNLDDGLVEGRAAATWAG